MLDRPAQTFDARAINRKAVKHWSALYHCLVDMHGRALRDVRALNHANAPVEPGRPRPHAEPKLIELMGPSPWPNDDGSGPGSWVSRGNGAHGPDVVSLVQHLAGGCDYRVAADFLKSLTDRIVEIAT
jgi:hypothetical protein